MNPEFILMILNYSLIPFASTIIISFIVFEGYRKLRLKSFYKHSTDLVISEIDKQTRIQASQIELMSHQFDRVNEKITEINKIIKQLEQRIVVFNDERSKSDYSVTPPMRNYVGNFSDIIETSNHDNTSQNHIQKTRDDERRSGTIEYILKKLETASLSTKDIQIMIGRTREHTSRLMKKLYVEDLVSRDVTAKPFKYTITDEGRKRLSKHSSLKIHSPSEYFGSESPVDRLIEN